MKRIISVLVVLTCLMIVVFPTGAFAEAYEGTCGENVTWHFDDVTGVLTISGTGDMVTSKPAPWDAYWEQIKTLVIEPGVTGIGSYAFWRLSYMTSVEIPDTVTHIDAYAFHSCGSLETIDLPQGLTIIGTGAFYQCGGVKQIMIPEGVTAIAAEAFYACGLSAVEIHTGVTAIGACAFAQCRSLREIHFLGDAPTIGADAFYVVNATAYYPYGNDSWTGAIMQDHGGNLQWEAVGDRPTSGVYGKDDMEWRLEDGTLYIEGKGEMRGLGSKDDQPWATYRDSIHSLVITGEPTAIGSHVCEDLINLKNITIPDTVIAVYEGAFNNCIGLTDIQLPDSVKYIYGAYNGCTGLRYVELPRSLRKIEDAFVSCENLEKVTLPESLKEMSGTFSDCTSLATIDLPEGLEWIGNYTFHRTAIKTMVVPRNVSYLGDGAFVNCEQLERVTILGPINTLRKNTFQNCFSLKRVDVPATVTLVCEGAFCSNESSYLEVYFSGDMPQFRSQAYSGNSIRGGTIYYPQGNETWTQEKMDELMTGMHLGARVKFQAIAMEPEEDPTPTVPVETEPAETEPVVTEPTETEPVETEPVETEPVETEPVETEPVETEPVETEPAVTEPVETEPVETEPAVTEPAETEPAGPVPEPEGGFPMAVVIVSAVLLAAAGGGAWYLLKKRK